MNEEVSSQLSNGIIPEVDSQEYNRNEASETSQESEASSPISDDSSPVSETKESVANRESNTTDIESQEENGLSLSQNGKTMSETNDLVNDATPHKWETKSKVERYTEDISEEGKIFGVSYLGRSHAVDKSPCQDYHKYLNLGKGWHLFLISDGAGSAKESHRGSRIVCEAGGKLIERLITKLKWIETNYTPTPLEWQVEFTTVCKKLKDYMIEQIEMLDQDVEVRDFNATLMAMVVSPNAMLVGHIGDGRMGYQDNAGLWHSAITPHKGEEKNQTIFVLNAWDKTRLPTLRMCDKYVPETDVLNVSPRSIMVLTDGCENFSWNCLQYDETGTVRDINTPYIAFWNTLKNELNSTKNFKETFLGFVDSYNDACRKERDDRTMIFAMFK